VIAEDHSDWSKLNHLPDTGGLGFDAAWYANFYHHLIGDGHHGAEFAKLLSTAGTGTDAPLAMGYFAGAAAWAGHAKVVYHESHDEAGNAADSRRTIRVAVNGAPLVGMTRRYAEARCRFVAGMSLLSAATPMFLMGEEVGAQKDYTYDNFLRNREDLLGERLRDGARLYAFYQSLIHLRRTHPSFRTHNVRVLGSHDVDRVIAFLRWSDPEDLLVVGSLNNRAFASGYRVSHPELADGLWREIFNSDSALYGGDNVGNAGAAVRAAGGSLVAVLPANGFVVFQRL
jgi:1,4-alpha-glucan branching enzyme